ncbi:hypothetical protein Tco_0815321 [Tanacetum coccineum]
MSGHRRRIPATTTPPPLENFSGEFSGQDQMCSSLPDLPDPQQHSPTRASPPPAVSAASPPPPPSSPSPSQHHATPPSHHRHHDPKRVRGFNSHHHGCVGVAQPPPWVSEFHSRATRMRLGLEKTTKDAFGLAKQQGGINAGNSSDVHWSLN